VSGMEGEIVTLQDLFLFDMRAGVDQSGRFQGTLRSTGLRPRFLNKLSDLGITLSHEVFGHEQAPW